MNEFRPKAKEQAWMRCGRLQYLAIELTHPEPLNKRIPLVVPHPPPVGSWAEAAVLMGWDGSL